ncbi:hypothetical protein N7539_008774 [Penicillium diatomitis]|uniref:Fungal-type protein kinase domain-containing protein n=1 Tax=Penicillium diatomitis TaxID=2819901 RepID=A0A9X0BLJ8_9EURO|nr:uncharacterized protein N7539_008774 [Penicillium diatomitis]KAJ5471831.1 hypothetical protein N7539_008774 [Penicillium diatomitis]
MANQEEVLNLSADMSNKLATFSAEHQPLSTPLPRRPPVEPNRPIQSSTAEPKLDIGFVSDLNAKKNTLYQWPEITEPGVLKSYPAADTTSKAWLDLASYAREVLAAQDSRHFSLGFTICGSFMRISAFDRLGGVVSERFDINKGGLLFVSNVQGSVDERGVMWIRPYHNHEG